ncbi:hypothetical protein WA026_003098 [Henosepilachna vigintioctopunctata]|uniref:Uncharacterized protein n=1 Tax=Henosepilachna vigintioctopunctata TaxID=420089 RepID=A0AAW1TN20_9CUCU
MESEKKPKNTTALRRYNVFVGVAKAQMMIWLHYMCVTVSIGVRNNVMDQKKKEECGRLGIRWWAKEQDDIEKKEARN